MILQSFHKVFPSTRKQSLHKVPCNSYLPSAAWTKGRCSHSNANCKPGSPNTMAPGTPHPIFQRSPPRSPDNGDHLSAKRSRSQTVAQTKFLPSAPRATLCENRHGFARLVPIRRVPPRLSPLFPSACRSLESSLRGRRLWTQVM